jgi:hypothetical protein
MRYVANIGDAEFVFGEGAKRQPSDYDATHQAPNLVGP